ncbi:hypothetical protein WJX82_000732 [Trebouxia sp. C0006]
MQRTGLQLLPIARLQTNPALACREVQQVVSCLAGDHGAHQISSTASKCKENMGEADSQTTKGVAAGGKASRSPSGAPETPDTTSQAPGGAIRPGSDPTGKDKGQQAATQKKQDPSQGKTVGQGSDVGGIQETGSGTGGTNPGLPLDADPLDAHRTDRLDDPEELLKRRRAKDPAAFDKVHGKDASFAEETGGKGGGKGDGAAKMTNNDASKHLGGRKGKQQTMKTNTKQGAAYTTWARGFLTSATAGGDDKAKEAQKTAGNPYAPTSSAGGTPTDNKDDEGKMPEEAKEVQMSGQQQGPQARSKQGAESQDGNKSTHKVSEKL